MKYSSRDSAAVSHPHSNHIGLIFTFGALSAFAPLATDMYLASFPDIASQLNASMADVQLSLSSYFIGLTFGQIVYAPIIDRFGRKMPLLIGTFIFALASAAIVGSATIGQFIGLRMLQALGGCAGMVISRVVIQERFNQRESAQVLSLMMMIQSIGPVAAPVLGGYLDNQWGWYSIFEFLALFGLVCFFASIKTVPETLQKPIPINLRSVFSPYLILFKKREFVVPLISGSLGLSIIFIFISASPFIFVNIFGLTREHYTWVFSFCALGMVLSAQLNHWLLKRHSPGQICMGALLVLLGASLCMLVISVTMNLWLFVLPLFFCIATVPITAANSVALAMSASSAYAGSASSIVGVIQFLFASVMSALVSVFSNGTVYPMVLVMLGVAVCASLLFRLCFSHQRSAGESIK